MVEWPLVEGEASRGAVLRDKVTRRGRALDVMLDGCR